MRIQIRRDTAANWSSVNPVLSQGELGWDSTGAVLKVGDGTTAWNSLPAANAGGGGGGGGVTDHAALTGRSGADQHPISAVTGLQAALDAKAASSDARFTDQRTPTDGSVTTVKVADNAVTLAKLAQVTTARLLGRATAGTGNVEELTPAQARTVLGLVIGTDVQAYDADLASIAALSTTAFGRALLEVANLSALHDLLGTGTHNSSTFLRGDGVWATPAGGATVNRIVSHASLGSTPSAALGTGLTDYTGWTTQVVGAGWLWLALAKPLAGDVTRIGWEITATNATGGQNAHLVHYDVGTDGLPTTLLWSEAIPASTIQVGIAATGATRQVTGGGYFGVFLPGDTAGTVTFRAGATPLSNVLEPRGAYSNVGSKSLLATSQGNTVPTDVSAYTYRADTPAATTWGTSDSTGTRDRAPMIWVRTA